MIEGICRLNDHTIVTLSYCRTARAYTSMKNRSTDAVKNSERAFY